MTKKPTCFVAYPSKPDSLSDTNERAIDLIQKGGVVDISGWKSAKVTGKYIINAICNTIKGKDIFICDLTNLNHNVLFELGYAIALNKRIWILIDTSIAQSSLDYDKFKLLTTIGYSPYNNSSDIQKKFMTRSHMKT